jgi:hypothetical protein
MTLPHHETNSSLLFKRTEATNIDTLRNMIMFLHSLVPNDEYYVVELLATRT